MQRSDSARAASMTLALILASAAHAAGGGENTTGLPSYPHDEDRKMDAVARSIPNGQHCTHYSSSSKDALATVIDWYKKQLPGAKVEDVNKGSLYGNYFKLQGVKLLVGNDIVNVYRMPDNAGLPYVKKESLQKTSIEIFKCNDASRSTHD
jgi:hypothetical protein